MYNKIVVSLLFFIFTSLNGYSLAPRAVTDSGTLDLDDLMHFFSIEHFTDETWEDLKPEDLQRLILTGNRIKELREKIYVQRTGFYDALDQNLLNEECRFDSFSYLMEVTFRSPEGDFSSDAVCVEEILSLLNEILKEKLNDGKGFLLRTMGSITGKIKPFSATETRSRMTSVFDSNRMHFEQIIEQLMVLNAPDRIRRILVVDDEKSYRDEVLEAVRLYDESIQVFDASSGWEAWDVMEDLEKRGLRPDLVISDQSMPVAFDLLPKDRQIKDKEDPWGRGLNGNELIERIKQKFPQVFCLMNTGQNAETFPNKDLFDGIIKIKSFEPYLVGELQKINIRKTREGIERIYTEKQIPVFHSAYISYLKDMAFLNSLSRKSA